MHWRLIYCGLLLSTVKLSCQARCPYAEFQHFLSENSGNSIIRDALKTVGPESALNDAGLKPYAQSGNAMHVVKPVVESSLTTKEIELLLQNYFNQNNIRRKPTSTGSEIGVQSFDQLFNAFVGTMKLECAVPPLSCTNDSSNYYYRSYDGSCNNLLHPGYGMANSRYSRVLPPKYGDGKYTPSKSLSGTALPNPRVLSLNLYGDDSVLDSYRTMMTMQWGQMVAHDISRFSVEGAPDDCCSNPNHKMCYPIAMHPFGPIAMTSGRKCFNFARSLSEADISCPQSKLGYSEKISTVTPYLDLSSLYGSSLEQNIKVRQYKGGLLKTVWRNNQQYLPTSGECQGNKEYCYVMPDSRNQLIPTISVLHTILVREHNRLASILATLNPHYSDEKLFQVARKINIAQYQKISYYDWLPLILGPDYTYGNRLTYSVPLNEYVNDYDESWDPSPMCSFSAAAFRYAHHHIPGWFSLVSPDRSRNQTMRLSDYFDRQESVQLVEADNSFDPLIRGLITQLQKRSDGDIDKELKHHLERKAFDEFGTDLKSLDIQRGRDYGLASYNDYREYCGLPKAQDWSGFADHIAPEKIALLRKYYVSPHDVDLSVGGSFEAHSDGALFGPTFQCIVGKQFLKTRKSDRFFFERDDLNTGFTREQLAEIRKVSLASLLCTNSANLNCVQPNVFVFPNFDNCLVNCQAIPQLNLKLWQERIGNY